MLFHDLIKGASGSVINILLTWMGVVALVIASMIWHNTRMATPRRILVACDKLNSRRALQDCCKKRCCKFQSFGHTHSGISA